MIGTCHSHITCIFNCMHDDVRVLNEHTNNLSRDESNKLSRYENYKTTILTSPATYIISETDSIMIKVLLLLNLATA